MRHDARPERVQVKERNIQPDDQAQATREWKAVVTGANGGPTVTPSCRSGSTATTPSQSEKATPPTGENEERDEIYRRLQLATKKITQSRKEQPG